MKRLIQILAGLILLYGSTIATTYYVDNDRPNDGGDGTSWATAEKTIAAAIADANAEGDVILVKYNAGGTTTYSITSTLTISGHNIKITSDDGDGTGWSDAEPDSSKCIIDANSNCRIFTITSASVTALTIIQGFHIYRGLASSETTGAGKGGGVYINDSAAPVIQKNYISNNRAHDWGNGNGGGIYVGSNNVRIYNNFIADNVAGNGYSKGGSGGGIWLGSGSNCIIDYNIIKSNGAYTNGGSYGYGYGGGIRNGGNNSILNNVFDGNWAGDGNDYQDRGSGLYIPFGGYTENMTLVNNVFMNHDVSGSDGMAIYYDHSYPSVDAYNCLFYNSSTTWHTNQITRIDCVVDEDPQMTDPGNSDYTLSASSPCIDAGHSDTSVPEGGEPTVDIGAKEYILTTSATHNGIDNSFEGNLCKGKGICIEAATGTVDATIQQFTTDPENTNGSSHIGKYWNISCTGNAKIRLYYPSSATSGFTTPTIYHYTGGSWQAVATSDEQTIGSCKYVESTNAISSWSPFTVGDDASPLPVELISFTAELQGNEVLLRWTTATEVNNYGFEVERQEKEDRSLKSEEGWETLGFVEGNGNSNSPKSYEFVDENPPAGKIQYRLKQIDTDGSYEYYSTLAEVNNSLTGVEDPSAHGLPTEFSLSQNYPNPFNPTTTIEYSIAVVTGRDQLLQTVELVIYDLLGREIATLVNTKQKPGKYRVHFDGSGLSSGIYFYELTSNNYSKTNKMIFLK